MVNKSKKPDTANREIGQLSESLEDYLEIIYTLAEKHHVARVKDIALSKKVKMSSVTSALKRLAKIGLVDYEAREFVVLTLSGDDLARRLLNRHYFLTGFLTDVLGVEPGIAAIDACSMEHALSQTTMNRLNDFSKLFTSKQDGTTDLVKRFKNRSKK
jgi:DtxR family transcriptional regulator, Mn-dependent transcriptional regulator